MRITTVLLLLMGLTACPEEKSYDDKKNETQASELKEQPILTLEDISLDTEKADSLSQIDRAEFLKEMTSDESLYANFPQNSKDEYDGFVLCLKEHLANVKASILKNKSVIKGSSDVKQCFNELFKKLYIEPEKTEGEVELYASMTCLSHELKESEKTFGELNDNDVDCKEYTSRVEVKINGSVFIPHSKQTFAITTYSYWGAEGMNECLTSEFEEEVKYKGCIEVSQQKSEITSPDSEAKKDLNWKKLIFSENFTTTSDPKRKWHKSGEIEFRLNNWSGKITYSGEDIPPKVLAESTHEKYDGDLSSINIPENTCLAEPTLIWINEEGICKKAWIDMCAPTSENNVKVEDSDAACTSGTGTQYQCYQGKNWVLAESGNECVEMEVSCDESGIIGFMTTKTQESCEIVNGLNESVND